MDSLYQVEEDSVFLLWELIFDEWFWTLWMIFLLFDILVFCFSKTDEVNYIFKMKKPAFIGIEKLF